VNWVLLDLNIWEAMAVLTTSTGKAKERALHCYILARGYKEVHASASGTQLEMRSQR
jgi:hypothetical protein